MHSPTRSGSLRAAGIAAILTAGLVLAGTPLAAFADEDTTAGSDAGTADAPATPGDPGTGASDEAPADQPDPAGDAEPPAEEPAPSNVPTLMLFDDPDVPDDPETGDISGIVFDGYGRTLAGADVSLSGFGDDPTSYQTVSGAGGVFTFADVTTAEDFLLCASYEGPLITSDFADFGGEESCSRTSYFAPVAGLRVALFYVGAAPVPDNAAALALTGLRAVGQTITTSPAPDWSSFEAEIGAPLTLAWSYWLRDGEWALENLQASPPPALSYTMTAADVPAVMGVEHIYVADLSFDVGGLLGVTAPTITMPVPDAPAPDSAALQLLPRGGVTTPASNTAGGTIQVTVGTDHDGEVVDGWLYSTPTFLGQAVVANGVASFRLPAGMTGSHTVAVSIGGTLIGWAPVTITAASGAALAETGAADIAPLAGLSVLILLVGGALMLTAARRRELSVA